MQYIYKDRIIHIQWSIFKGTSHVYEDFSRALVKCFLIGPNEKYLLDATAKGGTLLMDIPHGLPEGAYSLETIYMKNWGKLLPVRSTITPSNASACHRVPECYPNNHDFIHPHDSRFNERCLMRSRLDYAFAITSYPTEADDNPSDSEVILRFKSAVASYGYDGLSAYEIAVMRGDFNGTEGEWIESLGHGGKIQVDSQLSETSKNPVENQVTTKELNKKQNKLISGENIKTLNGESILGKGNIVISGEGSSITVENDFGDSSENPGSQALITSVNKSVNGIADEEDVTLVEEAVNPEDNTTARTAKKLKFKDKAYNPANFSGMGRVYLRKNIIDGKNLLDVTMIPAVKTNTRFIIQYDYDLNGTTLTIPEGCTLDFQGGSIINGTLVGTNTKISAELLQAFGTSVTFEGTWDIESVHPEWFGLKLNDPSYDNHDVLFASFRLSFKALRSKIILPAGVIYTTPLILKEFGIHKQDDSGLWSKEGGFYIQGSTGTVHHVFGATPHWGTTLRALPSNDNYCLLQLCSEKNMKSSIWDTWSCSNSVIENVALHCDKKCLHGINGNLNIYLSKVSVTSATSDGIVMEDYSYPFILRDCYSVSNGGNGIFIKGPMSTVVLIENCEFANNDGYGMYIEGSAFSNFNNIMVQGNKRGGVKIIKDMVKYASRPSSYFLQNLTFYNLYCEANGKLPSSDSNYDGNYNVFVTANPISELSYNKPNSITINGGNIGGNGFRINNVYGLTIDNGCGFSNIYVDKTGLNCVGVINKSTGNYVGSSSLTKDLMPSYYTGYSGANRVPFLIQRGGFTQERGQTHKYLFKYDNILANEEKYMKTDLGSNEVVQYYLLPERGSVKSLSLFKRFWKTTVGASYQNTFTGTIRADVYIATVYSGIVIGSQSPIASVTLDHTTINYTQEVFKFLEKEFSTDALYRGMYLVVKLTASSDWNSGKIGEKSSDLDTYISCIVEVEEAQNVNSGV